MAMFGKTYSNDEKRKARADLMEKRLDSMDMEGNTIYDMATNPSKEGPLGRGGTLRNKYIGLRKKKPTKSKGKRKSKKKSCGCK